MIESASPLFQAVGLSTPAGLNAYLVLLLVGLAARFTTLIQLRPEFAWLSNEWVLLGLGALLVGEVVVDKVVGLDHLNDVLGTVVRPLAGALLFVANGNLLGDMSPWLAAAIGLLLAGSVHGGKALARPVVSVATAGLGNPVVSLIEDGVAAVTAVLAIVAPVLAVGLIVLLAVLAWRMVRRRRLLRARHLAARQGVR